jgi:hypothetical protein
LTIVQPLVCGVASFVCAGVRGTFGQQPFRATRRPKRNKRIGKTQLDGRSGAPLWEARSGCAEQIHSTAREALIEQRFGARKQQSQWIAHFGARRSTGADLCQCVRHANADDAALPVILASRKAEPSGGNRGRLAGAESGDNCVLPVSAQF